MALAHVNGTELFYELTGSDGPLCLVMHGGLGMDHTYFRPDLDRLGSRVRVVYYDHRGNGRSARPPVETITIEQLADDADALAAHLGADRVLVIGHSYGGFVAQELLLRHPERVAGAVLVATTPGQLGTGESMPEASGPPPPPEFIEAVRSPPQTDEEYAAMMRVVAPHYFHRWDPSFAERLLSRAVLSAAAGARGMEVLQAWSSVDRLPSVTVALLLVVGAHDVFTSPSQSYRIARCVPGAEVVELPASGHFPWMEEPEAFFGALGPWLDRHT